MKLSQSPLTHKPISVIITDEESFKYALRAAARRCYDAVARHATPPLEEVSKEIMDAFFDYDPNVTVYEVQYYVNALTIKLLDGENIDNIDPNDIDEYDFLSYPHIGSVVYGDPSTYQINL